MRIDNKKIKICKNVFEDVTIIKWYSDNDIEHRLR
nr:MAG TPA: hypothetical protein [Caudoviricetes sp.]